MKGQHRKDHLMKIQTNKNKYTSVLLSKGGKRKKVLIHRAVAQAFISNPNELPQVNHKDENKSNNSVDNLEWCNSKYNCNYGSHNKRLSKAKNKAIIQLSKRGEKIKIWQSAKEAEKTTKIWRSNICKVVKEKEYLQEVFSGNIKNNL